jgi:ATP-dependent Clp protease ATP-binding subunit ClpA
MFERFTGEAREVVMRANAEAEDLGHVPIGTQHLLLALTADHDGAVAAALRAAGVDEPYVRDEVIKRAGHRHAPVDPLPDADGEDAAALRLIGIDLDAVRRAIEENFGPGALKLPPASAPRRKGVLGRFGRAKPGEVWRGGHRPFSPRSKKILELSLREAIRLKHNFIAPQHIMLGILREGEGMASRILADKGIDVAALRDDLTRSLDDRAA